MHTLYAQFGKCRLTYLNPCYAQEGTDRYGFSSQLKMSVLSVHWLMAGLVLDKSIANTVPVISCLKF